jgi:hypothetical protein
VGSLKAAKRRGLIDFKGQVSKKNKKTFQPQILTGSQMLLMPVHKDVVITLKVPLDPSEPQPHHPKPAK